MVNALKNGLIMNQHEMKYVLAKGDCRHFSSENIVWINPAEAQSCRLSLIADNEKKRLVLKPHQSGVLMIKERTLRIEQGALTVFPTNIQALTKLQAFIDTALQREVVHQKTGAYFFSAWKIKTCPSHKSFEHWLITLNIQDVVQASPYLALLRSSEHYWLIRYLLENERENFSLKALGEKYGVSVSHFRRLSRSALGNTVKEELCHWRLSRALLDLLESEEKITDVAFRHGYASLSHFSNDVKNALGYSPRELKNKSLCDGKK